MFFEFQDPRIDGQDILFDSINLGLHRFHKGYVVLRVFQHRQFQFGQLISQLRTFDNDVPNGISELESNR